MKEIWKDIEGYEGLYQVSNFGKVKNTRRNKELYYIHTNKKYLCVRLCKNGKKKYYLVHRLVAQAFIPNPENKLQVNHKDCDRTNNNIYNLEWVTPSENCNYKTHNIKVLMSRITTKVNKNYPNEKELIDLLEKAKEIINKI